VPQLFELCKQAKLSCQLEDGKIIVSNALEISPEECEKILEAWVKTNPPIVVKETPSATVKKENATEKTPSASADVKDSTDKVKKAGKEKKTIEKKVVPEKKTVSAPVLKTAKIVPWDEHHIYSSIMKSGIFRLNASFSKRNYVFVHERLAAQVRATNKYAYNDLMSMCDVGHVLGNSIGGRGFLIGSVDFSLDIETPAAATKKDKKKSAATEPEQKSSDQLYIKGKNAAHDWRFFGRSCKVFVNKEKDKRYTLFMIDSWSSKHKEKPSTPEKFEKGHSNIHKPLIK
jgi:hypothetical protein